MNLKQDLLTTISADPIGFRKLLIDEEVKRALSDIGVLPKILELHAPSSGSRGSSGLGRTLCGLNGTRHSLVTCKKCKQKL
jgi:hypothetical protein